MKNHAIIVIVTVIAATAAMGGCGDDPIAETGAGGAGGSDASSTTTTTPVTPSSSTTTTVTTTGGGGVDESTSCADALPLVERDNDLGGIFYDYEGVVGEPDDVDYFTIEAAADSWIRLTTSTEDGSDINTVVTLYNEDGTTQLAENNNRIGGSSSDSEIAFHVIDTGTYCIGVQDWTTWTDNGTDWGPTYTYRMVMVPVDFALYDFYNTDIEPNDTTTMPQTSLSFNVGTTSQQINTDFAGIFASPSDVDVYQWTAPMGVKGLNMYFTPDGTNGFGSTQDPGMIRFYEADGTTVLAELDVQQGATRFSNVPIIEGNDYLLEVNMPAGASAGANDFYYLKFSTTSSENMQEADDIINNNSTGAQAAPESVDGTTVRHFLGGRLQEGDDDWWTFDAEAGNTVVLVCSSWRAGSGVRDMTASIYLNPTGTAIQTETEVETATMYWSDTSSAATSGAVTIATTGTHYLKVGAATRDPLVSSNHYLCGIHLYQ